MTTTYTEEQILEHRAQWIAALRSGEYQQTTGQLQVTQEAYDEGKANAEEDGYDFDGEPVGFCCLGVACDLAVKAGVIESSSVEPTDGALPSEVAAWLGTDGEGQTSVERRFSSGSDPSFVALVDLNDSYELTFDEIADLIEEGSLPLVVPE